jgi:hypothetical protein
VGNRREEPHAERGKLRFFAPHVAKRSREHVFRVLLAGAVLRDRLAGLLALHAERSDLGALPNTPSVSHEQNF